MLRRRYNLVLIFIASVFFATALSSSSRSGQPKEDWGDRNAQITNEEFLDMYFNLHMHAHEDDHAFNSFNMISFCPSSSSAKALLVIIQTYNAKGHTTDEAEIRQQIRELASTEQKLFEAFCASRVISKRWKVASPKNSIVIKHVRAEDVRDILAVTFNGETSFDPADFKKAEGLVKSRGGVWSF